MKNFTNKLYYFFSQALWIDRYGFYKNDFYSWLFLCSEKSILSVCTVSSIHDHILRCAHIQDEQTLLFFASRIRKRIHAFVAPAYFRFLRMIAMNLSMKNCVLACLSESCWPSNMNIAVRNPCSSSSSYLCTASSRIPNTCCAMTQCSQQ